MFAIIETGGKQYKVSHGDRLRVEKIDGEEGVTVSFDSVLLRGEGSDISVGDPRLEGVSVEAKVLSHGRRDKVLVFKYKPKKRYRKKAGHRQPFTEIEITNV